MQKIYEYHNFNKRGDGFSILKEERGQIFSAAIGQGKKILDLGCRDGALTSFFIDGNKVTGADIDTIALAKANKNLGIETVHLDLNGDWHELKKYDSVYDVVVLAETLEHLYYPDKILEKILKLLHNHNEDTIKDGGSGIGTLIGSVPNAFNLKNRFRLFFGNKKKTPLQDPTHINHFSHKELKKLLKKYFREVKIIPLGKYAFLDRLAPGMFSFDLVFICRI